MMKFNWLASLILISANLAYSAPAPEKGIDRDEFKRLVKILKQTMDRLDNVERRNKFLQQKIMSGPSIGTSTTTDGAVDLNAMSSAGKPPVGTAGSGGSGMGSAAQPTFKTYFDLDIVMQPGINNFSFDNFHQFLFFEIVPNPNLQFTFHIDPTPRYFELDYNLTKRVQLRAGKIWIPFDDLNPHSIFGGRVNTSRIAVGGATFLPDVWANLGLGVKITVVDSSAFSLITQLYIVNGFRAGGTDPATGVASNNYPNLSDTSTFPDNNRDKALGARVQAVIGGGHLNIGASAYTCRWSQEADESGRLIAVGVDTQIRFAASELRAGLAGIISDILPTGTPGFTRGGAYAEFGQRFGKDQSWKFMLRGGVVQLDSRVVASTDQILGGGTILYKPGPVEFSLGYSRDFRQVATKANYDLFIARVIMAF